ncbi:MAG: sugar-binding transcriptional regulator [Chloroflexi bacterium]|nr:sugar-binding transcriptional regulator [Chloroflexota bacterium]
MADQRSLQDRASLLADVADMYYRENKNQAEIAKSVGVTRSMISRMLTEARDAGIVEIRVHRSLQSDHDLGRELIEAFDLLDAYVVRVSAISGRKLTRSLGRAGALVLKRYLAPGKVLGLAWGTSISATVDALDVVESIPVKVVQLVGAMGARNLQYDGHDLVSRLSEKLGGEAYYVNAPYVCQDREVARSLMESKAIKETISLGKKTDVALLGIGSTSSTHSSFYLAGYVTRKELDDLRRGGSIGDVCGLHFDLEGRPAAEHFSERLVTIQRNDLLAIPVRLGVAGGPGKVQAILGALKSRHVNVLVTDQVTAKKVLDR